MKTGSKNGKLNGSVLGIIKVQNHSSRLFYRVSGVTATADSAFNITESPI